MVAFGMHFFVLSPKDLNVSDIEKKTQVIVLPDTIRIDGDSVKVQGKNKLTGQKVRLLYTLTSFEEKKKLTNVNQAFLLVGTSRYQAPTSQRNYAGFDYDRFLKINREVGPFIIEEVMEVRPIKGFLRHPILSLRSFRTKAIQRVSQSFPPMTATYMQMMLLGYQGEEQERVQDTWRGLGLAHIFALSGLHITFFLLFFNRLLLRLGLTKEVVGLLEYIFVAILVVMTGFAVGMIRAALFISLKKLGKNQKWGFSYLDYWAFGLMIHSMVFPYVLLTVAGQLSYSLSFMILFIEPTLKDIRPVWKQQWLFTMSLSFISLPFVWHYFFEWNVGVLILNVIFSPILFSFIMPLLLIELIAYPIIPNYGVLMIDKGLVLFQLLADKLDGLTIFKLVVGRLPLIITVAFLAIQLGLFILLEQNKLTPTRLVCLTMCLTSGISSFKYINPVGTIAFVDVGQGDCLYVQRPFFKGNYLIDTGGSLVFEKDEWQIKKQQKQNADYTILPYLKSRGVKQLDTVFISHAHEDHFGNMLRISEVVPIKQVVGTQSTLTQPNVLKQLTKMNGTTSSFVKAPWKKELGDITFRGLYPLVESDGQNNDSLVIQLEVKETTFLLVGDLEKEGEQALLAAYDRRQLNSDILKVGHHGSQTSSSLPFLQGVQPKISIISCGRNNRFSHPSEQTIESLEEVNSQVYQTDKHGMIYFRWLPWGKKVQPVKVTLE